MGVDLDLIVHGIDISQIPSVKDSAFLAEFAKKVRDGLVDDSQLTPSSVVGYVQSNSIKKEDIHVTVGKEVGDAISVRAQIPVPAPTNGRDRDAQRLNLENWLANTDELFKAVERHVQEVDGMQFFSTWTKQAVKVSMAGIVVG